MIYIKTIISAFFILFIWQTSSGCIAGEMTEKKFNSMNCEQSTTWVSNKLLDSIPNYGAQPSENEMKLLSRDYLSKLPGSPCYRLKNNFKIRSKVNVE